MTHQKFAHAVHARTLLSLLVLVLSLVTAASASAAAVAPTAPAAATDPSTQPAVGDSTPSATPPGPTPADASAAPTPAPPAAAGPTGGTSSEPPAGSNPSVSPLATEPVTQQPTPADTLQPQQVVIAAGSATTPIERPSRDPSGPPAARASSDQPVVSTTRPPAPAVRAAVTQLTSGGPFVAASSQAASLTPQPTRGGAAQARQVVLADGSAAVPKAFATPAALLPISAMSLPLVGVYIGRATSPHHADAKASPVSVEPPVGPSGLAATSSSPFGSGPLGQDGGTALLGGNTPFSSAAGSVPLLGLNAMLAAVTLLAGLSWRRRSWDLPVLRGESALLASALDRPG